MLTDIRRPRPRPSILGHSCRYCTKNRSTHPVIRILQNCGGRIPASNLVMYLLNIFITARSELRKVLFLAPPVCFFLFVYEIYWEPLNGFAPNSNGRRVWSLARTSLKVKAKGQRSRSPGTKKRHFSAGVRFMFGETSLASGIDILH